MSFRGVGFLSQARCFFLLPVFCTKLPAAASCLTNLRVNLLDKKANNLPEWQTIPLKVQFKLPTYKLLLPFCALYSTFLLFFFYLFPPLESISFLPISVSYLCCLPSGKSSSLRFRVPAMPVWGIGITTGLLAPSISNPERHPRRHGDAEHSKNPLAIATPQWLRDKDDEDSRPSNGS